MSVSKNTSEEGKECTGFTTAANVYFASLCNKNPESTDEEDDDEEAENDGENGQWRSEELKLYFKAAMEKDAYPATSNALLNTRHLAKVAEAISSGNLKEANLLGLSAMEEDDDEEEEEADRSSARVPFSTNAGNVGNALTIEDVNKNLHRRNKTATAGAKGGDEDQDDIFSCSSTSDNCSNLSSANTNPASVKNMKEFDDDDDDDENGQNEVNDDDDEDDDEEEDDDDEEEDDEDDDEDEEEEEEEVNGEVDINDEFNDNHIKESINSVVNNEAGI